jgi:hypothetical protein
MFATLKKAGVLTIENFMYLFESGSSYKVTSIGIELDRLPKQFPDLDDLNSFHLDEFYPVWRSYIRRNCRYFSFRPSVSALGFGPRVSRLLHLSGIHLKYPIVRATRVAQLHSIAFELRNFMFKIVIYCECNRSRGTFGRNMVEYHMVRGPKPRAEMIE